MEEWAFTAHGLKKVEKGHRTAEELFAAATRKRKRVQVVEVDERAVKPGIKGDFKAWKKEVQSFGADNLAKKQKQDYQAREMLALGIKAAVPPRTGMHSLFIAR